MANLALDDGRFVEASFGQVNWVRNLRASGAAVVRKGRGSETVQAIELAPRRPRRSCATPWHPIGPLVS